MKRLLAWIVPGRALRKIGKTDNRVYYVCVMEKGVARWGFTLQEVACGLAILAMNEESEW